jgi:four helix bundle protein
VATSLEDLKILQSAETIADEVWKQVTTWSHFPRSIVGGQLARAADSVGANIAEAYGRYHFGEKVHHLYIARGSLFETKYWLNRSESRKLIPADIAASFASRLTELARQLNSFVSSLRAQQRSNTKGDRSPAVRENRAEYLTSENNMEPFFSEADMAMLAATVSNL